MKLLKTFALGILGGLCISLGGVVMLSVENRVLGALFFTVGLFIIVTFGFNLFTGKVCYALERGRRFVLELPVIWLGNLAGAWLMAQAVRLTRIAVIAERAAALSQVKLDDKPLSIFLLAVLCNILIFVAVDGFAKNPHELGKYLSLFFGVSVFIICGFEHCVANMFYFSLAGVWSWRTLFYVFLMTLGNACGGLIIPLLRMWLEKGKKA